MLTLRNARVTALAAGDFAGLTALITLDLSGNRLTALPAGVFDGLTSLTTLRLYSNRLATLRSDVFAGLTNLSILNLDFNDLQTLPAGVFGGLKKLNILKLNDNPGAPFAPTAVAVPDDGTVPAAGGTVTLDGSGGGGPWGGNVTYSWALTTPSSGVTVSFDDRRRGTPKVTIPAVAAGTELTFTLTVTGRGAANPFSNGFGTSQDTATVTVSQPGICTRTAAVQTAILGKIEGVDDCADVTATHLAAITGSLSLSRRSISSIAAGDFAGLTALTALYLHRNSVRELPVGVFDDLTSLTTLNLQGNNLSTIPVRTFARLTSLTHLYLSGNSLSTLTAGVFDGLTALTNLTLYGNSLTALPARVFDGLTALNSLDLWGNSLGTLPAGVFDDLTSLTTLLLYSNKLRTLPAGVFEPLKRLTELRLELNPGAPFEPTAVALPDDGTVPVAGGTVRLDGSGSGGAWGENVNYSWELIAPANGVEVTFADDNDNRSITPMVTIPPLAAGTELTFRLTVTGRAANTRKGARPGRDTATVTAVPADTTAPTVMSIVRQSPASSPTNADILTWRVTFSEDVANVDAADFEVSDTAATLTVAAVPGSLLAYDVTAVEGGLADLTGTVTLSFASGHNIVDTARNALANTAPTGANDATFVLDRTAPTMASVERHTPSSSPTNADRLTWRVTFSEAVANVDAADFAVSDRTATLEVSVVSGVTGAFDVTASGGNLGNLDGTVTLTFATPSTIRDVAGNVLDRSTPPVTNEVSYVVDNIAPTVTITGVPDISTGAFTATITFTEGVRGFAVEDIAVGNGTASAFTGSAGGREFTALITPTENGTVTVDVAEGVAEDALGNGNLAAARVSSTFDPNAGICGRTAAVRDTILAAIAGVGDCALVTGEHLAAITGELNLAAKSITALAAGDFAGLTALTGLDLNSNALATLPAGVFDSLTKLTVLNLRNNTLTTLPAAVFARLAALETLFLNSNTLATLPAGVFAGLTSLTELRLATNPGAPFAPVAVALPDDGTVPVAGGTVPLDGSGSDGGPWGANVEYSWALTTPANGVTVPFDDDESARPMATIPAQAAGTELTFTLTVTGRGSAHASSTGVDSGTDTAKVTATATDANAAPVFTSAAAFNAAENQTAVGTVQASDGNGEDSVTGYAITGGADASKFRIGNATGVLAFATPPNYEAATDADGNNAYVVVVRATSGADAREKTADQTITVTVTDVDGEAPGVPATPTVSSAGATSVTVSWVRAREHRAADHGLRLPVPGKDDGGGVDGGDGDHDHGSERDDHVACGEHRVRGAGAGEERRGHERLVRIGQRHDGRERGADVHLGGGVQRGGEPDRGGDGAGVGRRRRRQCDGLRDRRAARTVEVLDRHRERRAGVQCAAELRGRDGRGR